MARRSPADQDLDFSFIPFMDVLVAALGIFIVVLVVTEWLHHPQPPRPHADVLALLSEGEQMVWYLHGEPQPERGRRFDLIQRMEEVAQSREQALKVIIALDAAGTPRQRALADDLERLIAVRRDDDAKRRASVAVVWWPISGRTDAFSALLARWRGEEAGKRAREGR